MSGDLALDVVHVAKHFGGLSVLEDVCISVVPNTVHGIIGPNGAGKSTLFNMITGLLAIDQGEIEFFGKSLAKRQPHQRVPLGMARTFQNIRLFKNMTVEDNVLIGQHSRTATPVLSILTGGRRAREWEEKARAAADAALREVGLEGKKSELAKNLPYGQQKMVEFARALATQPKLILLDEPAAGMNPAEKAYLVRVIATLKREGYTVALIEHDMTLIMNVCDTISVLDHGRKIAEGDPQTVRNHPDVITAYLGRGDVNGART